MADWHVGQMVVCVDADSPGINGGTVWMDGEAIYAGRIYTITSVHIHCNILVLWLAEVRRSPEARSRFGDMVGYRASRFRPVRKTSIDIFRSLLTPTGDDGAATPRSPVRVPSLPDRVEQGSCHYPRIDEACVLSPGITSRRATLAAGLARYADGRPLLSIHCKSSALSFSSGSKQTTGATTDAGNVSQSAGKSPTRFEEASDERCR